MGTAAIPKYFDNMAKARIRPDKDSNLLLSSDIPFIHKYTPHVKKVSIGISIIKFVQESIKTGVEIPRRVAVKGVLQSLDDSLYNPILNRMLKAKKGIWRLDSVQPNMEPVRAR